MALDNKDFEKLYNQYSVLVYNLALNYLQNIEDAEEIKNEPGASSGASSQEDLSEQV
jgi:hypothetical protein